MLTIDPERVRGQDAMASTSVVSVRPILGQCQQSAYRWLLILIRSHIGRYLWFIVVYAGVIQDRRFSPFSIARLVLYVCRNVPEIDSIENGEIRSERWYRSYITYINKPIKDPCVSCKYTRIESKNSVKRPVMWKYFTWHGSHKTPSPWRIDRRGLNTIHAGIILISHLMSWEIHTHTTIHPHENNKIGLEGLLFRPVVEHSPWSHAIFLKSRRCSGGLLCMKMASEAIFMREHSLLVS